jgi:peptide deformylase
MIESLVYYGDARLRQKCAPISDITLAHKQLAQEMIEFIDTHQGIGLACPQIGRMIRMFVLRKYLIQPNGDWVIGESMVYVNPKIVWHSPLIEIMEEGCLSIPGIKGEVPRPFKIRLEFQNLEGQLLVEELEDINARVVLHENDHLNGVLYIDRMDKKQRHKIELELNKIKKKYHSIGSK